MNIQKLLKDPVKQLSVRYEHNKHNVPDMPDTPITDQAAKAISFLIDCHDAYGGRVHKPMLHRANLQSMDPDDAERILHLLHRSKVLVGGYPKRRNEISRRYDTMQHRLDVIMGEIDAGNDNLAIKQEGRGIARTLKNTKRLNASQYLKIIEHLKDPPMFR